MAIAFKTTTPKKLLNTFKKAIDDGHVVTWSYDSDGDFKHTPSQWADQGYLRPAIQDGASLKLTFLQSSKVTTYAAYGTLQGRFIESMIVHCHDLFSVCEATPKPVTGDSIRTKAA